MFVAFIDDDAIAENDWLQNLVETYKLSESIGGVGGPAIVPNDSVSYRDSIMFLETDSFILKVPIKIYKRIVLEGKYKEIGLLFKSGAYSIGSALPECINREICEVDHLAACNLSFRKDILEVVDGFDERFYHNYGESDLCLKVRIQGYKILFNPKAVVWHNVNPKGPAKGSYKRSIDFIYFYSKNMKIKSMDQLLRFCFNLSFLNAYYLYKFLSTRNVDYLLGIKGIIDGFIRYYT